MGRVQDKIVVVTGAAMGLSAAACLRGGKGPDDGRE